MLFKIYTIYDRVAEEAGPLFVAKSDAVAVRNFRHYTKDVRPDEYRLYRLGDYDTDKVMVFGLNGKPEDVLVPTLVEEVKEAN